MLFLLEGKWLFNKNKFESYRSQLLEKYIKEDIPDHQLNKFFLNDIIRYYRTIATDFEYKVAEKEQSWGLRNIKLRFSRKLLYFGGIIVVAETSHKTRNEKIETTKKLLDMSPLERIEELSNVTPDNIFTPYETFLKKVSDKETRDLLKLVDKDKRNECEEFKSLRNLGHHFSWALSLWLRTHYDSGHPIHHSLLF